MIITGTRHGSPYVDELLESWFKYMEPDITAVLVGCAPGVDTQAEKMARRLGLNVERYPADWSRGKRGGPERNTRMVATCGPGDVCIAFPDTESRGTYDCADKARDKGLVVLFSPIYDPKGQK